jgi:hypothetical protein
MTADYVFRRVRFDGKWLPGIYATFWNAGDREFRLGEVLRTGSTWQWRCPLCERGGGASSYDTRSHAAYGLFRHRDPAGSCPLPLDVPA